MEIVDGKDIRLSNKDVVQAIMEYCQKTFPTLKYKHLDNVVVKTEKPLQSLNNPEFDITIYVNQRQERKKSKFTIGEKLSIINSVFKRLEKIDKKEKDDIKDFDFF